jgi:hypothetical protein
VLFMLFISSASANIIKELENLNQRLHYLDQSRR